nr:immunoglobulin heavy chain junction region [Mus musculus]
CAKSPSGTEAYW